MPCVNTAKAALVILIGGESRRMGQDKARLKLASGQELWQFMQQRLRNLPIELTLFSGSSLSEYPVEIPQSARVDDCFSTRCGPVGGIISSVLWLEAMRPDISELFVLPVDSVALSAELIASLRTTSASACHFQAHPLPLFLRLNSLKTPRDLSHEHSVVARCHALRTEVAQANGCSVRHFLSYFDSVEQRVCPHPAELRNLNYYSQWEGFCNENSI